jgi:hypothetical protein
MLMLASAELMQSKKPVIIGVAPPAMSKETRGRRKFADGTVDRKGPLRLRDEKGKMQVVSISSDSDSANHSSLLPSRVTRASAKQSRRMGKEDIIVITSDDGDAVNLQAGSGDSDSREVIVKMEPSEDRISQPKGSSRYRNAQSLSRRATVDISDLSDEFNVNVKGDTKILRRRQARDKSVDGKGSMRASEEVLKTKG